MAVFFRSVDPGNFHLASERTFFDQQETRKSKFRVAVFVSLARSHLLFPPSNSVKADADESVVFSLPCTTKAIRQPNLSCLQFWKIPSSNRQALINAASKVGRFPNSMFTTHRNRYIYRHCVVSLTGITHQNLSNILTVPVDFLRHGFLYWSSALTSLSSFHCVPLT